MTISYHSEQLIAQGRRDPRYRVDLGLRKTLFDRKLFLSLNVRDLLDSRLYKGTTFSDGFYEYSDKKRYGRMFGFTLTYNFGNVKKKETEGKGKKQPMMETDGEVFRIGGN